MGSLDKKMEKFLQEDQPVLTEENREFLISKDEYLKLIDEFNQLSPRFKIKLGYGSMSSRPTTSFAINENVEEKEMNPWLVVDIPSRQLGRLIYEILNRNIESFLNETNFVTVERYTGEIGKYGGKSSTIIAALLAFFKEGDPKDEFSESKQSVVLVYPNEIDLLLTALSELI